MKILVTGISGQLGFDVMRVLEARSIEAIGVSSADMDIRDKANVDEVFARLKPDVCIHPAAWTAVDKAEDERESAWATNVTGTYNIASACALQGTKLMYFSTDYVFNGKGEGPWKTEDEPDPINFYGKTKLEGENLVRKLLPETHFILRLEWVYGINGKNFVKTMLGLARTHTKLRVVNDQIGTPTYTLDIADLVADMALTSKYGTYHVANEGYCSWYDFAKEIFEKTGMDVEISGVSSAEYSTRAMRPHNSRMDTSKLLKNGFKLLPPWEDALSRFLSELEEDK